MLEFENQMFIDILNEDGLVITAKGIGLDSVFVNLLKVYSDPGNLVLVLGTSDKEEEFFIQELNSMDVKPLPRLLTSEIGVNDRYVLGTFNNRILVTINCFNIILSIGNQFIWKVASFSAHLEF